MNDYLVATLAALRAADHDVVMALIKAAISIVLIYLVLLWLASVYRGSAGDDEIEKPVSLTILDGTYGKRCMVLAPRHLNERTVHHAKAPKVQFFVQLPAAKTYQYKSAALPLKLSIRDRNRPNIYDQFYDNAVLERRAPGGQIGVDYDTHQVLAESLARLSQKEGRQVNPDTSEFIIRLRYPTRLNLWYLLVDHPDTSVRVGAWVFILTSLFSVLQEMLTSIIQLTLYH